MNGMVTSCRCLYIRKYRLVAQHTFFTYCHFSIKDIFSTDVEVGFQIISTHDRHFSVLIFSIFLEFFSFLGFLARRLQDDHIQGDARLTLG